MIKRILYGTVGVMIGGVVFVLCLINVPQDDMGEISTTVNSNTELPVDYQAVSPVRFNSYHITDYDLSKYTENDTVHYGVENPMFLDSVELVTKDTDSAEGLNDAKEVDSEDSVEDTTPTSEDALIKTGDIKDTEKYSPGEDDETILDSNKKNNTSSSTPTDKSNANILNSSFMNGYAIGFDLGSKDQSIIISDSRLINTEDITAAIVKSSAFPLEAGKYSVSSGFGEREFVDVTPDHKSANEPKTEFHSGIDLWSSTVDGAEVKSIVPGTIESITPVDENNSGAGNYVVINHGKFKTLYGHMSRFAENIKMGDEVLAGAVIGYVGTTGRSTGPHLHFEILVGTYCIDPEPFVNKILNK